MYVIGDIGNTETKICVYSTQKKIIKKIILKSNLISNNYLKKQLFFILKKKYIKKFIFSSVVPRKFKLIKSFISKNFKLKCFEIKELRNIYLPGILARGFNPERKTIISAILKNSNTVANQIYKKYLK